MKTFLALALLAGNALAADYLHCKLEYATQWEFEESQREKRKPKFQEATDFALSAEIVDGKAALKFKKDKYNIEYSASTKTGTVVAAMWCPGIPDTVISVLSEGKRAVLQSNCSNKALPFHLSIARTDQVSPEFYDYFAYLYRVDCHIGGKDKK
ncbi:hypothetical protein K2X33_05785 [bacterium]|nr:hypothetical protein [bacterium]